jgi:hypothetical protein
MVMEVTDMADTLDLGMDTDIVGMALASRAQA